MSGRSGCSGAPKIAVCGVLVAVVDVVDVIVVPDGLAVERAGAPIAPARMTPLLESAGVAVD